MKKLVCLFLSIISAVLFSTAVFGTDITSDLIGKFSFEGNVVNDVTGEEAVTITKGYYNNLGVETEPIWNYIEGVNGTAIILNEVLENNNEKERNTDALKLLVSPSDGLNYTVSLWCKALIYEPFDNPIIWIGSRKPRNYTEVCLRASYYDFDKRCYFKGPLITSYDDENDAKVYTKIKDENGLAGIKASEDNSILYDWLNVTMVVENGVGKVYYDGYLVTDTGKYPDGEVRLLPDVLKENSLAEKVCFCLGTDKEEEPFTGYVDELYIYDRALTDEDIKELVKVTNVANVPLEEFSYYEQEVEGKEEEENTVIHGTAPSQPEHNVISFFNGSNKIDSEQYDFLEEKAREIVDKYDVSIILDVYEEWIYPISINEYADLRVDFYEDSIVVVIDEESGKCVVTTGGKATKSISKVYGCSRIWADVAIRLKFGDTYGALNKSLDLMEDFNKEAEFLLPYGFFNPYKSLLGIIIRIFVVLFIAFILLRNIKKNSTKLKEYSKGREPFIKPEVSEFKKTPPYIIKFKTDREEFIQKIDEMCKLKYVPEDFTVERFYDDITEMYLEYYSVMGTKEASDKFRFGWIDDKDTYFRVFDEFSVVADDNLIKTIEPYEGDDIEVARMDKSVGELERRISMPAWVLNVTYNGKIYTFVMNGQTGKFAGQVPLDYKKYKKEKMTKVVMILVTVIIVLLII